MDPQMDRNVALGILRALADGCDPETGEVFPREHVLQQPSVIRALGLAVRLLCEEPRSQGTTNQEPAKPCRAGIAWTPEEDRELLSAFGQGATIAALASKHERTRGAIESRLVKQGRLNRDSDESPEGS